MRLMLMHRLFGVWGSLDTFGGGRVVLVDKRGFYFDEDNNVWRNTRSVAATFVEVTQVVDEDNDVWRIVKSSNVTCESSGIGNSKATAER